MFCGVVKKLSLTDFMERYMRSVTGWMRQML